VKTFQAPPGPATGPGSRKRPTFDLLLAHPEAAGHAAGETGRLADIDLGAGRLLAEHQVLGDTPSGGDPDRSKQALLEVTRLTAPAAAGGGAGLPESVVDRIGSVDNRMSQRRASGTLAKTGWRRLRRQ
jgi:hypothetical protein